MMYKYKNKRGELLVITILLILFINTLSFVSADTGFTNQQSLYFTGSSTAPGNLYKDAVSSQGNSDVGIELCTGISGRYVGAFYAINVDGTWYSSLISYAGTTAALGQAYTAAGGACYDTLDSDIVVSPSYLENEGSGPDPEVFKAAFPGRLWIGHSGSQNPGSSVTYVFADNNARLLGSYELPRSYDQDNNQVEVNSVPDIVFTTYGSGNFEKDADSATFGVSSERKMVAGLCDDDYGNDCSDGGLLTSPSFGPYDTDINPNNVDDQHNYTKYVVINGLGYPICIGANSKPVIDLITPNPIYYSQTLNVSYSVTNPRNEPSASNSNPGYGGNVGITSTFYVNVAIYQQSNPSNVVYNNTIAISEPIDPSSSITRSFEWPAYAHSGRYIVMVTSDYNDNLVECHEGDNVVSSYFDLEAITLPEIFIDGVETSNFTYSNVPYNMTFHLENSDGDLLNNADVILTETNGLSLCAPTQFFNITVGAGATQQKTGLITETNVNFITDYYGNSSFTFIPTYNKFYLSQYNYTDLDEHLGNYSLVMTGTESDNDEFVFIIDGSVESEYPFTILTTNYTGTYANKAVHYESMVSQALDFIYQTFSNFLDVVVI